MPQLFLGIDTIQVWHWIVGFAVLALPIIFFQITRGDAISAPLVAWCFGSIWITVAWVFVAVNSDLAWQEVRLRLLMAIYLLSLFAILCDPIANRMARKTIAVVVMLVAVINVYELFSPFPFNQGTSGRSAAFYGNPNDDGFALVLGMVLSASVMMPTLRAPFMALIGVGVFVTFSRSSTIEWLIAVIGLMITGKVRGKHVAMTCGVCIVAVMLFLIPRWDELLTTWERSGVMSKTVLERLEWFGDPTGVSDTSSWERKLVARRAWEQVGNNPIIGNGPGSYRGAYVGAHNQYLAFMQDYGVTGALIVPALLTAIIWRARGEERSIAMLLVCVAGLQGFFTHNLLEMPYLLLGFALMAGLCEVTKKETVGVSCGGLPETSAAQL